ncbi:Guanylate kinase 1 [Galdieria sulphuraria]|nr:Guanylate kinase 1 [Galdieria sulphuraria]
MPQEGQVCRCPGKWKNQLLFGVIEKVDVGRPLEEQCVDVRYLKPRHGGLYEVDRCKKRAWFKLSEIKLVSAKRLPQDMYFVEEKSNLGNVSLEVASITGDQHMTEYNRLFSYFFGFFSPSHGFPVGFYVRFCVPSIVDGQCRQSWQGFV